MKNIAYKAKVATLLGVALPGVVWLGSAYISADNAKAVPVTPAAPSLRALVVGGGPTHDSNQVSIASNVRYVRRLLPSRTPHLTLFANGDAQDATVLDGSNRFAPGEVLLRLILDGEEASFGTPHYSKPSLGGRLDGASSTAQLGRAFAQLGQANRAQPLPLLLYFTGHGSPGWNRQQETENYDNNTYGLWGSQSLSVRELAKHLSQLPPKIPVTLVMVQCYAGGFGNVLFKDGDPKSPLVEREIAGFFASIKDHTAAGCTSEVNEKEYRDFTSYFFAALCGQDRVGRRITGADYNADKRVGMDEAYYYTVGHDESIDIPTSTSEVFLRRFVPADDAAIVRTPYRQLLAWATPAQKAALSLLSTRLKLSGEERLLNAYRQASGETWMTEAYRQFAGGKKNLEAISASVSASDDVEQATQKFDTVWKAERTRLLQRYPLLAATQALSNVALRKQVMVQLVREADKGQWKRLLNAYGELNDAYSAQEADEIGQSLLIRFVRLGKTIALTHQLNSSANTALKARFARLLVAEGRTLLPPVNAPFNPKVRTARASVNVVPQGRDTCACHEKK